MQDFKKVVRIGTTKTGGGRWYSIFCTIQYGEGVLSITGVEGPLPNGGCLGGCGQINDTIRNELRQAYGEFKPAPGWSIGRILEFLKMWDDWHLNNLHAGCEHQRNLGWEGDGYDKHPSEPCPICDYEYGTAWHTVVVPDKVLQSLSALPNTDRPFPEVWA